MNDNKVRIASHSRGSLLTMNQVFINISKRAYGSFSNLMMPGKLPRPLLSMTMHEWSELVLEKQAMRNSVSLGTHSVGLLKLALDVHAHLSKEGMQPNINSFNRLIMESCSLKPDGVFPPVQTDDDDSKFQQTMSLFACMEQEPLLLKPNEQTFELAMMTAFKKGRLLTLTESLFQLMQTPAYGLVPTRLCWLFRISAVMTKRPSLAADEYYDEFKSKFALDSGSASLLICSSVSRNAWGFMYNRLLPDIDAASASIALNASSLAQLLSSTSICSIHGIPFIRWALRRDMLNTSSPLYFSETLCIRWLTWIADSDLGCGVSDIAFAAMQRIIELRNGKAISKRILEKYLQILEVEESGIPGTILRYRPGYQAPLSSSALHLATQIKEELQRTLYEVNDSSPLLN